MDEFCNKNPESFKLLPGFFFTYLTMVTGSRDERIREALTKIGPAVLNGCVSTFLSIVLLAGSNSHIFDIFFKVRKIKTAFSNVTYLH